MADQYKVGQVLFVIDSERNAVLPCQVIEQVTKKTLEGDQVMYKVIFGIEQKNVMDLANVKGEVYTSLHEVKKVLLENVTKWVDTHVQKAAKAAMAWYKYDAFSQAHVQAGNENAVQAEVKQSLPNLSLDNPTNDDNEPMMVEVAPGKFAKVKSIKTA